MTVAELIRELQKYPAHQSVLVKVEEDFYLVTDVSTKSGLSVGSAVTIESEA